MSKLCSLLVVLAAACGSSSTPSAKPAPASPAPVAAEDGQTTCVAVFTKNRTCTDDFIPALVDLRAKHDMPAGMAASVKQDRDAVIVEAKKEWVDDSKDEAISAMCQKMLAQPGHVDAETLAASKGCLATEACGPYVSCIMPVFDKQFSK